MSITDELREYANTRISPNKGMLLAIADRIDAEHDKAIKSVMNDALYHANDKDMADLGWVRLPKDADGKTIHVGDVMEWPYGNGEFVVEGIGGNTLFYIDKDSNECEWTAAGDKRHHHAPTVEDVLEEFVARWMDTHHDDIPALKAEYAAKLRLAGDAE